MIHLTGKGKDDEVRSLVSVSAGEQVLGELGPDHGNDGDYRVAPYLERIDLAFACADLIICRSGAGTVSELTALGLPAIYVPLPIGNGEQRFNAQPVVDAEGGLMVADREFTAEWSNSMCRSCLPIRICLPSMATTPGNTVFEMPPKSWPSACFP